MNCNLDMLVYTKREGGSCIGFHNHINYELVYYISGSGSTQINQEKHTYKPYTFTIIEPNTSHDEFRRAETELIFFGFTYYGPILLKNGIYEDDENHSIYHLLENLKREFSEKSIYYELKMNLILQETIVEFYRLTTPIITNEPHGDIFKYVKNYIENYYNQKIEMQHLAQMTSYSYHHFRHLFKKATGYSPLEYIHYIRMKHARKLLATTNNPISLIAMECGFNSIPQFNLLFKRKESKSPTEFRRELSKSIIGHQVKY
jgi:AraC-like DNA-binding protein